MKKSRKIDDIFRRNLGNAETTPPADVWQNILDRLPEEKPKKRVLPIWYPLAGTAAAVVIFLLIFNSSNDPSSRHPETTISYDLKNSRPEIKITSSEFEEAMWKSSINLEAARLYNRNSILSSGNSSVATNSSRGSELIAAGENSEDTKLEAQREEKLLLNTSTLHDNKGLAEEDTKEEPEGLQEEIVELESLLSSKDQIASEEVKDITEKAGLSKRFSVTTTAGAIYFNNFGSGNTVDARFAGNENSGEISMSYGVNLAYQISETVRIRSGVSKVDIRQNTRDVDFASAVNSRAVNEDASAASMLFSSVRGNLNQQLGFIEVPVEIEYALVNKKIGLSLIGGGSALFLEENMLSLDAANFSTDLGEANNLNATSYSANLGIGVHYNISSHFRFNVEPVFKYQINTFTKTPNLNPYYFGIYSGLSFKF